MHVSKGGIRSDMWMLRHVQSKKLFQVKEALDEECLRADVNVKMCTRLQEQLEVIMDTLPPQLQAVVQAKIDAQGPIKQLNAKHSAEMQGSPPLL